ncbi:MAG: SprB repeat-containing protein, partial [Bacteroidota bacterium]
QNPITTYGGGTASPVTFFARIVYPDGCVSISTLTINFQQPDGNAGNDATIGPICANDGPQDLQAALGGGLTTGAFSDDNGTGVDLSNPSAVDFSGVATGTYNFTYTTTDEVTSPDCPADQATVTVDVTANPVANSPTDLLTVCVQVTPLDFSSNLNDIINQISGGTALNFYLDAARTQPIDPNDPADQVLLAALQPAQVFADFEVGGCFSNLVTIFTQITERPATNTPEPLRACDPGTGVGTFDLNSLTDEINAGSGATVIYYFDQAGSSQISNPGNFSSFPGSVFAIVGDDPCRSNPVEIALEVVSGPNLIETVINVGCFGDGDGSIELSPSGGLIPYTIDWSDDQFDGQTLIENLGPGNYSVVITDANGCDVSSTYTITQPAELSLVNCGPFTDASSPVAMDGSASISVGGGTGPYTITYSGQQNGTITEPGPTIVIPNLGAGNYDAVISDVNGCTATASCPFSINAGTCSISFAPTSVDVTCNGGNDGAITLNPTGTAPFTFDWDDNTLDGVQDPAGLTAGTYTVMVTDASGCTGTETITITEPLAVALVNCGPFTDASSPVAMDGSASISVAGGTGPYTITYSGQQNGMVSGPGPEIVLTGLGVGNYTANITDANGCSASVSCPITIGAGSCSVSATVGQTNVTCNGGNDGAITL